MKHLKLILSLTAALLFCSLPASAQKGAQAFGADGTVGIHLGGHECISGGFTLNYQYYISNHYRIKPFIAMGYSSDWYDCDFGHQKEFYFGIDNNIILTRINRFLLFINLGIGYGSFCIYAADWCDYIKRQRCSISTGIGTDYRFNKNLALQFEVDARQILDGHFSIIPQLGVAYYFKL